MSIERKQILSMLAEGKITAEDAERLLDKIGKSRAEVFETEGTEPDTPQATAAPKYLRVLVNDTDGDKVNIRVPLALVRTGLKFTTIVPTRVKEKLAARGVDLSELSELKGEELLRELRELSVDVDGSDGETVRIFCE